MKKMLLSIMAAAVMAGITGCKLPTEYDLVAKWVNAVVKKDMDTVDSLTLFNSEGPDVARENIVKAMESDNVLEAVMAVARVKGNRVYHTNGTTSVVMEFDFCVKPDPANPKRYKLCVWDDAGLDMK